MWTAESIRAQCQERISKIYGLLEQLESDPFQVWVKMEELILECDLYFPRLVSPDPDVREASDEAANQLDNLLGSLFSDRYRATLSKAAPGKAEPAEAKYYWKCVLANLIDSVNHTEIKSDLNANYNRPRSKIFLRDQLDGLEFDGDSRSVSVGDCPTILNFCHVEETRRAAAQLEDCVEENVDLIRQLGLEKADHPQAKQMYDLLLPRVLDQARQELALIGKTNYWDYWYERRKLLKPTSIVSLKDLVDKTIEFFSGKFSLRFVASDLPTWHSSVQSYQVFEGDQLLGDLYLDLERRDYKVGNASTSALRQNLVDRPGAVAILMQLDQQVSYPSLKELLHEFGHALHCLYGRAKYARFFGSRVDRRYLEFPSQYCELFLWDVYGQLVSEQELADAKFNYNLTRGIQQLHDIAQGMIDLELCGPDPQAIADKLWIEITGMPRDSNWLSGWWQLYNGYHGLYWTYMFTEIMAKDLFGKIDLADLLRKGGSVPFEELVDFKIESAIASLN